MAVPPSSGKLPLIPYSKSLVTAFPTPEVADSIVSVLKETDAPKYQLQPYGTPHPDPAYVGYVLVFIEPQPDGQSARWHYQKLPGEPTVNKSVGVPNLTPLKHRRGVHHLETTRAVVADADLPTLTGDQAAASIDYKGGGKASETITEEVIDENTDPLPGSKTAEFGLLDTLESVVYDGTPADIGFLIQDSQVDPIGNGKSIKKTEQYASLEGKQKVSHTLGVENLTPPKYRRLIRHDKTESPVQVDYSFPAGLTGNQSQIEFAQENITRARLTVTEEIINVDENPLVGAGGDEYGLYVIYESIVEDGEPVDSGFLIKHSQVDPIGNGKSIKITLAYTSAQVAAVALTTGGSGYASAPTVVFTGGGGSGAAATATVVANVVTAISMTSGGTGYTSVPVVSFTGGGGSGAGGTAYLGSVPLISRPYDEEMRVRYQIVKQIVMVGCPDSPPADYVQEELKALDVWRSLRTRTTKVPTAVDEASAVVSYRSRPYAFPGLFPPTPVVTVGGNYVYFPFAYRKTTATLVDTRILTYWVLSDTAPAISGDNIITDSIFVFTAEDNTATVIAKRFEGVLHDAIHGAYFATATLAFAFTYAATTPSYTDYVGTWIGNEKNISAVVTPTEQARLWRVQLEKITMR